MYQLNNRTTKNHLNRNKKTISPSFSTGTPLFYVLFPPHFVPIHHAVFLWYTKKQCPISPSFSPISRKLGEFLIST